MALNLDRLVPPISLRPSMTLSDEELMRFSADNKGYKIERTHRGEITIMSPVGGIGPSHEGYVYGEFYVWAKRDGSGKTFSPSGGFNLPDGSCLSPDVGWITLDRWNSITLQQQTGFPPLTPDFVIEVRSASDSRPLLEAKMELWLDNGARLAWLVDPIDANVTIYRPGRACETLSHPPAVAATDTVEGFVLDCTSLWATS